jgi:LL-diaminopimelate aminotransferase
LRPATGSTGAGGPKGFNGQPSIDFALRLLEATAVVVTPGVGFGPGGEGYFRISLTTPDDRLEEALLRLVAWSKAG